MSRLSRGVKTSGRCPRCASVAVLVIAGLLFTGCGADDPGTAPAGGSADAGRTVFAASCAGCHGATARGTSDGPPLVHRIYEPSHHSDAAFVLAVRGGSPQHHWSFGDMPPVPGIDDRELADTIAHVRRLQEEAGIR